MTAPRRTDEERRKLFRRMEWVYVYAPPVLAVLVAAAGGALLAFLVPLEGIGFWGRWGIVVGIILGVPLIAYIIRELLSR